MMDGHHRNGIGWIVALRCDQWPDAQVEVNDKYHPSGSELGLVLFALLVTRAMELSAPSESLQTTVWDS